MKIIVILIFFVVVTFGGSTINEIYGTSKIVSKPYVVVYPYCAVYYPNNPALCMAFDTVTQVRVDTEVDGLFYNTKSYNVVEER